MGKRYDKTDAGSLQIRAWSDSEDITSKIQTILLKF